MDNVGHAYDDKNDAHRENVAHLHHLGNDEDHDENGVQEENEAHDNDPKMEEDHAHAPKNEDHVEHP